MSAQKSKGKDWQQPDCEIQLSDLNEEQRRVVRNTILLVTDARKYLLKKKKEIENKYLYLI